MYSVGPIILIQSNNFLQLIFCFLLYLVSSVENVLILCWYKMIGNVSNVSQTYLCITVRAQRNVTQVEFLEKIISLLRKVALELLPYLTNRCLFMFNIYSWMYYYLSCTNFSAFSPISTTQLFSTKKKIETR